MRKRERVSRQHEHVTWMPMTDMLASTLMITFLFIAVSTIIRAMNAKPPVITLEDTSEYRFATGSFLLTKDFKETLLIKVIPKISRTIRCYGIDTIEIIGHTDGRPGVISGNLDYTIEKAARTNNMNAVKPGSNVDLGFLRAMAVRRQIQSGIKSQFLNNVEFRILSAGSTLSPDGKFSPGKNIDEKSRRRIEIKFLRVNKSPFIPRCT